MAQVLNTTNKKEFKKRIKKEKSVAFDEYLLTETDILNTKLE